MDKFQFFISSTYEDLKEERNNAINIVMKQHQIPAGMELFGAMGEEQWNYIKREIDESDYYLLILAGKYGSLNQDGISYTEAEYEYACKMEKRIIAFLYSDIEQLPVKKVEQDIDKKTKLERFRDRVKSDKLVEFWSDTQQLNEKISSAISNVMREYPSDTKWIHVDKCIEKYEQPVLDDKDDEEDWKFQETKGINLKLDISNDTSNPSQAVMTGEDTYVVLERRDGPICSYMKHACEEYVKLIRYNNNILFSNEKLYGFKEVLCIRKMWFDTKNPNVVVFIDYLYNYDIHPTYSAGDIKKILYDGDVLGDGQAYSVMIRTQSVNMYSDHFFINNKEFYDEGDKSRYIDVKINYTKFEYKEKEQKKHVVADLEITNKSREKMEYTLNAIFKMLDDDMYKWCEAKNLQGAKTFILQPFETKVEYYEFIADEDIEKNPVDIETFVIDDKPKYE